MNIESHAMALSKILTIDDTTRFHIPDYQRHYSWKPEQIDQLFNDIMNEEKGYYIGNLLVTANEDNQDADIDIYDVIDGQQRLTTLSLFLLAIWEQAQEWCDNGFDSSNTPKDVKNLGQLQGDIKRRLLINEELNNPRLQLLDDDDVIYGQLLHVLNEDGQPVKAPRNRTFTRKYEYIRGLFRDGEDSTIPTVNKLREFYDKLINITLLQIEVGNLSDAFTVFSSLNSTGLPLTLVDLLKGRFIELAQRVAEESKDSVLKKWATFTDIFTSNNSDADITTTTQFLLNNYDAFENESTSSTTKGKSLKQYRDIIQQKYRSNVDYLQEIIDHAQIFAQLLQIQSHPSVNVNQRLSSLRRLESTQAYPLMLFLLTKCDELKLDDDCITRVLDALISFYVRRNITLVPKASNIRARMLKLVQDIRGSSDLRGDELVDRVIKELKELSVSDEQFATAITSDGMYDKNAKTTRFVLIEVERYLNRTTNTSLFDKGHPDNLDDYKANSSTPLWSIEHILPEGPLTDYWRAMIAPDDPDNAEDILEQYKHLIGNLTLTPYNSNLGQRPFADEDHPYTGENPYQYSKRDYADHGHFVGLRQGLAINAHIADTEQGESIETKTDWTPADIQRRTEWFKDQILTVFKFPALSMTGKQGTITSSAEASR